jgi:uncharacterized protein YdeI (BOF family)
MRWFVSCFVLVLLASACAGQETGTGNGSTTTTTSGGIEGPVFVESTEILYLESFPVQVRLVVQGSLPTPCHQAQWTVEDTAGAIEVSLWSVVALGQDCAQVLEPFEVSIPLGSFESSTGAVVLNGDEVGRLDLGVEPAAGDGALVGAGWSFGMCLGFCNADLAVHGQALVLTARDREASEPLFSNGGTLTGEGQMLIDAAVQRLSGVSLDSVYGCPDCADGGAAYLMMERDGVTSRHDMEFGRPPEVMAELHGLATRVIDALETCVSNELITVSDDCEAWEGF